MRALGLFGFLGVSFAALVAMDKITRPVIVKQTEQVRHLINLHQRFRRPIGRFFFFVEERFFCFRRIRCDHYKPLYLFLSLSLCNVSLDTCTLCIHQCAPSKKINLRLSPLSSHVVHTHTHTPNSGFKRN